MGHCILNAMYKSALWAAEMGSPHHVHQPEDLEDIAKTPLTAANLAMRDNEFRWLGFQRHIAQKAYTGMRGTQQNPAGMLAA